MAGTVNAKVEGNELVVRVPLKSEPTLSKSGRTYNVASTNGNIETDIIVEGKPLIIGLNAYIKK